MSKTLTTTIAALTILGLVAGVATANPRGYVAATGDFLNFCLSKDATEGGDWNGVPSQGGTCFGAGHVTADSAGNAVLSVTDQVFNPLGVRVCQDIDNDNLACEDGTDPTTGNDIIELDTIGCGSALLLDQAHGGLWNTGARIVIYTDGPIFGTLDSYCVGSTAPGTSGTVNHS